MSTFVIYFLSFLTFTRLAFQVQAASLVNNWWWLAACWVSKALTNVWAAGTRWQLALTWHTNTNTHTHIYEGMSHSSYFHSPPPPLLSSLPPSQEIVSNNNERWVLEVRYCVLSFTWGLLIQRKHCSLASLYQVKIKTMSPHCGWRRVWRFGHYRKQGGADPTEGHTDTPWSLFYSKGLCPHSAGDFFSIVSNEERARKRCREHSVCVVL